MKTASGITRIKKITEADIPSLSIAELLLYLWTIEIGYYFGFKGKTLYFKKSYIYRITNIQKKIIGRLESLNYIIHVV